MNILFIHRAYPEQFGPFSQYLAGQGCDVVFATARTDAPEGQVRIHGAVKVVGYRPQGTATCDALHLLQPMETALRYAQGFAVQAQRMLRGGYTPDVVMAHAGWGVGSLVKTIWPTAKYIAYGEWWYDHPSRDSLFADDGIDLQGKRAKAITQNLPFLLDWAQADGLMVPTHYQARGLPPKIRRDAWVVHDGVDTDFFSPGGDGVLDFLPNPIPADAPVVTYATRGMEPHRGFPQFMQAISALQKTHLDVHVIIAGRDRVYYGRDDLPDGQTWKTKMLADYEYDRARLHFTGPLPYGQYRDVLRRSHAHVYLTVPFVLSWSLIEAMATACPIITNDCPPTKEALPDESSAQFVNFLDVRSVLDGITHMLDHPTQAHAKGAAARDIALHQYTQSDIFPQKYAYIRSIATAPL